MSIIEVILNTVFEHMIKEKAGGCFGVCLFLPLLCGALSRATGSSPEAKAKTSEGAERLFVSRNAEKWLDDDNMSEQLLDNFCSAVSMQVITGRRGDRAL